MNLPTEDGLAVETIEDVGGEFGFRIVWSCLSHWANFRVFEVVSRTEDGQPSFTRRYWVSLPDHVEDIELAVPYVTGFVKWDGCCEFDYPEGSGAEHFCGARDLIKHFALLKHLYLRAGELCGHNHVESPWPTAASS
jgi:hypothetical protein